MNSSQIVTCLAVFCLTTSLVACGPTAAECPDGFTALRDRCVATPRADGGLPCDDADAPSGDAAPDDAGALSDAGCATEVTYFADADGDGAGAGAALSGCVIPAGHAAEAGDCDATAASRRPGAPEVCNGADDDCDAAFDEGVLIVFYADADGDGFGDAARSRQACTVPAGYAANDDDCHDGAASTHPGAVEVCDGEDDDCDAAVDEGVLVAFYPDCDGDGFAGASARATLACTAPATTAICTGGWTVRAPVSAGATDCRVADPTAFPGQTRYFTARNVTRPPAEPVVGDYDYDCDGLATLQHPSATPASCTRGPTGFCTRRTWWTDGSVPACGATAEPLTVCGVDCSLVTDWAVQGCR